ncbi:VanZ like family protein [Microbacterium hydrocarbonoxydans]|uniref:VanZ like family protein n=1 Tax=Microbacterium hydrocarbonoxydans TaxID=273678 RepID=A0A0M2HVI9_9MICO|nr:VanZ family protein [Microbacterium hydrocarbonoxydans]KJL48474.1 VanZ like family protein [Microbacterium hydrocarbonoxydans]
MGEQIILAFIAIAIGIDASILLFVPFVAVSYRRRGGLSLGRSLLWFAALVYFWAIWTYTLLPLPDPDSIRCVGMITDPLEVVRDLQKAFSEPGNPLRHPALLQLVLNVLLFVPLGVFLRVLGARGIVTALAVGLGLSLLIETTQLTGVWGLYPCAYRFFDVGDLMTNTTGSVLGSIFALVVPRAKRGMAPRADADQPRPVTRGRRAIAMVCDALAYGFVMYGSSIVTQLWFEYVVRDRAVVLDGRIAETVGIAAASGLWLAVVLITGRSVGDLAVQLRFAGARMPVPIARLLRWAAGIGGIGALPLLGDAFDGVSSLLILVSVVLLFTTRLGRGLPGLASGQELVDARADAATRRRV